MDVLVLVVVRGFYAVYPRTADRAFLSNVHIVVHVTLHCYKTPALHVSSYECNLNIGKSGEKVAVVFLGVLIQMGWSSCISVAPRRVYLPDKPCLWWVDQALLGKTSASLSGAFLQTYLLCFDYTLRTATIFMVWNLGWMGVRLQQKI